MGYKGPGLILHRYQKRLRAGRTAQREGKGHSVARGNLRDNNVELVEARVRLHETGELNGCRQPGEISLKGWERVSLSDERSRKQVRRNRSKPVAIKNNHIARLGPCDGKVRDEARREDIGLVVGKNREHVLARFGFEEAGANTPGETAFTITVVPTLDPPNVVITTGCGPVGTSDGTRMFT